MRKPLSSAPVLAPESIPRRPVLADLNLKVVTPMFGGGVDPRTIDSDHVIRPSAIRGHLRFWWRACNAARFTSLKEMHREERLLWGSVTKKFPADRKAEEATWGPGLIGIDVVQGHHGTELYSHQKPRTGQRSHWEWRREGSNREERAAPDYVLFPFTAEEEERPRDSGNWVIKKEPDVGRFDVTFRLKLTSAQHTGLPFNSQHPEEGVYPDAEACRRAAEQALWAWITFGGVGARTRRGCGSLLCVGNSNEDLLDENQIDATVFRPDDDVPQWIQDRYHALVPALLGPTLVNIPSLTNSRILIKGNITDPFPAWNAAVKTMWEFTQKPNVARHSGKEGPGQSWWPEVSSAREIFEVRSRHKVAPPGAASRNDFPRTELGLPRLIKTSHSDKSTMLQGRGTGEARMASPLILKSLPLTSGDAISLVLLLTTPHVWDPGTPGVEISDGGGANRVPITTAPRNGTVSSLWPWKLPKRPPKADDPMLVSAREAFMAYVESQPGWSVVP